MSIKFENVFFTYQENTPFCTHALNNINLEINDNEFVGLIGHTGSGKSTLAKLIIGLLEKESGEIKIFGQDLNIDTVKDILVRNMEEAAKLHVKLEVEVKEGSNWDEAH